MTETDLRLLTMLSWSVRAIADSQAIAALGIPADGESAFIHRVNRVARRRLLARRRVPVALIQTKAPLVDWLPGMPEPRWHSISWQLQRRSSMTRAARVWVTWATREAVALVGGVGGRLRQPMQLQHDLGVTAVYVARQAQASMHESWIGEDAFRTLIGSPKRSKIPDALIVDRGYQVRRVIEFGGLYGPKRLKSFHRYWSRKRIPYEIW
jgi:hypothetical protein